MLESYTRNLKIEMVTIENEDGRANRKAIEAELDDETAAVIVQNPNFFGLIDDFSDIAELVHSKKALLISSVYPVSLGLVKTPGEMDVDIVAGEGQSSRYTAKFWRAVSGLYGNKAEVCQEYAGPYLRKGLWIAKVAMVLF